ncbi:MAG: hypothetical protein LBD23_09755 [Oscillospiraceae bacterium]|jgi:hypothetical protein|nr:hypothetical protein [Oscillospiraceae bacterium]
MIIHLTKKLADKLKLTPCEMVEFDGFFSWRAHYVRESGQSFVIFMNDESRFIVVIDDAKAARLKVLPELFFQNLYETLLSLDVSPEVIEYYFKDLGEIAYAKNSDRKKTAQLNKQIEDILWSTHDYVDEIDLALFANELIYNTSGVDDVVIPKEKMIEMLGRYGLPVIMNNKISHIIAEETTNHCFSIESNSLRPLNRILEYIENNPDRWGTVITSTTQGTCEECGRSAKVFIDDNNAGKVGTLCDDCYNRMMVYLTGANAPNIVPKRIIVTGKRRKVYDFDIEFMIYETGKLLTATEVGKQKRRVDVHGELDDDFNEMMDILRARIERALSVKYMSPDGTVKDQKMVGYIDYNDDTGDCDIIIDGDSYTWDELYRNIPMHEGWKIKIEFAGTGDEID